MKHRHWVRLAALIGVACGTLRVTSLHAQQGTPAARIVTGRVTSTDGDRPLQNSTFYAPGAPRSFVFGLKYTFGS